MYLKLGINHKPQIMYKKRSRDQIKVTLVITYFEILGLTNNLDNRHLS